MVIIDSIFQQVYWKEHVPIQHNATENFICRFTFQADFIQLSGETLTLDTRSNKKPNSTQKNLSMVNIDCGTWHLAKSNDSIHKIKPTILPMSDVVRLAVWGILPKNKRAVTAIQFVNAIRMFHSGRLSSFMDAWCVPGAAQSIHMPIKRGNSEFLFCLAFIPFIFMYGARLKGLKCVKQAIIAVCIVDIIASQMILFQAISTPLAMAYKTQTQCAWHTTHTHTRSYSQTHKNTLHRTSHKVDRAWLRLLSITFFC